MARAVLSQHSKSFALAGRLLPQDSRDDAAVLYAFCRRADDAIDLCVSENAPDRLSRLRHELASVYAGEPQVDPLLSSFQELVKRREIPMEYPRALLDGLEMDLGRVRFETLSELMLYAYRVAGVVGLMMCRVLRVTDPRALLHAAHLGIAMQLTNVCRDVLEDRQRGRTYIPAEILVKSGASSFHLGPVQSVFGIEHAGLTRSVQHLLRIADDYYRSGDLGLPALSARAAFAVRAARHVYSAIGTELSRQGYDPLRGRAFVPRSKKLLLVARAGLEELAARLIKKVRDLWQPAERSFEFHLNAATSKRRENSDGSEPFGT